MMHARRNEVGGVPSSGFGSPSSISDRFRDKLFLAIM